MSKKIISILLAIICLIGLVSCAPEKDKKDKLPPVTTVGLPKKEQVTTSYETDGFVVNIYKTYSEIAEYKGKESVVTVPDAFMGLALKSICEYAFFGNEVITKVTLPDPLLVIGKGAFQDCTALTEVILGSSVELISPEAFRDSSLEKINLPESVAEIGRYAFYRTRVTEIKLPSNLSTVSKYAFYGCEQLTKIEFGPRIERIAEYAFFGCLSLTEAVIPDNVKAIGDYTFSECTSLIKIFVPKKTALGENPFLGNTSMTVYSPSGSKAKEAASRYGYSYKECASANKMP